MNEYTCVYGPVPSRRLGISLGISPIPKKTCNYSCIYCQLGRTNKMTNTRQMFYPISKIITELKNFINKNIYYDVITIVGEGEPTLYLGLGQLIEEIHKITDKPIAVITNGALLYDSQVQQDLSGADIVLPTLDAYNETSFNKINRPHGTIKYSEMLKGLESFSKMYKGQLWLEIMFMKDINDDDKALFKYLEILKKIKYEKLYLNTPVRPPAESYITSVNHDFMNRAADILDGVSIDLLVSQGFHSEVVDDYDAVLGIIKRHPMNQFEVESFIKARGNNQSSELIKRLEKDDTVDVINYKGYITYRLK